MAAAVQTGAYIYQHLKSTVAAFFLWSTQAFVSLMDVDEYMLLSPPFTSVQQVLAAAHCASGCASGGCAGPERRLCLPSDACGCLTGCPIWGCTGITFSLQSL